MELDPDKDELEDNGLIGDEGEDDDSEDDEIYEPPLNLFFSCQRFEDKQPCTRLGKCITFDQANALFSVCEYFNIDEDEEGSPDWEEN